MEIKEYDKDIISTIYQAIFKVTGIASWRYTNNDCRESDVIDAKRIAIFFIRNETKLSTTQIGKLFSLKHCTAIHHLNKHQALMETDLEYQRLTRHINHEFIVLNKTCVSENRLNALRDEITRLLKEYKRVKLAVY